MPTYQEAIEHIEESNLELQQISLELVDIVPLEDQLIMINAWANEKKETDINEFKVLTEVQEIFASALIARLASREIASEPFKSGKKEIQNLKTHFEKLALLQNINRPEDFTNAIINLLADKSKLDKNKIRSLLDKTFFIKDLFSFIQKIKAQTDEIIDEQACWIKDPDENLYQMIGPEAKRLLSDSRDLGLIPLETKEKLRNLKIVIVGASVAASTIENLIKAGAENITFVDPGELTISGEAKLPSNLADWRNTGNKKTIELKNACLQRNPHGNYTAHNKYVTLNNEIKENEISIHELLQGADIVIEVIDNPFIKLLLRQIMALPQYSHIPLMFIGDFGAAEAIAGFEKPGDAFNQDIDNEKLQNIIDLLNQAIMEQNPDLRMMIHQAVFEIVKNDFPEDHSLIFLLNTLGILADWPQTNLAASQSSTTAEMLILQWLHKGEYQVGNITAAEVPTTFIDLKSWTKKDKETYETLRKTILSFPLSKP